MQWLQATQCRGITIIIIIIIHTRHCAARLATVLH
jgi:hypothetical protein